MADSKITALASISTSTDPAVDPLVIVDVSDTSMAATGTTKKVTLNNLLSSSPTASGALTVTGLVTAGSATITGDLTVRTTGLVVNTTGVGMGMTPAVSLDITNASAVIRATSSTGTNTSFAAFANTGGAVRVGAENSAGGGLFTGSSAYSAVLGTTGAYSAHIGTNGNVRYSIDSTGISTWSVAGTTAMTLNATGLGVGGAPISGFRLNVNNGDFRVSDVQNEDGVEIGWSAGAGNGFVQAYNRTTSAFKDLVLNAAVTINTSGNVGIGVTPSAGKGCLQLSSGINFPATQVASSDANTLDDYVEATFSPTVVGSTTAGTATYATQLGRYTKIGRVISFSLRVAYSAGSGTGNLRIGGLPAAGFGSNFAIYAENIALTAGNYPVCGITSGNTYISVDQLPTGGGAAAAVPYDAAGDIQISGTYIV